MKDKYTNERILLLHPKAIPVFQSFIKAVEVGLNITPRIGSGFRSFKEQQDLYDQGRTKPGKIVTNAKPGQSAHNFGLGIDLFIVKEDGSIDWNYDMSKLAEIAKAHNIEWGGNWHTIIDKPHFQVLFGHTLKELLDLYYKGNLKNGFVQI